MAAIAETTLAVPIPAQEDIRTATLQAGIALGSFALLLLELSLTRLFSVIFFYHFAFLAISIALLGLGAGGIFAHLGKDFLSQFELRTLMARLSIAAALFIPAAFAIVLRLPVSLDLSWPNFFRLAAVYVASTLPFFVCGLQLSIVFGRRTRQISRLYGADLIGGALACLAIVPLLNQLGGPNTILFSALVTAMAAIVWAPAAKLRKGGAALAAVVLLLIAGNHSGRLLDVVYAKGELRKQSMVEFARWNAISRVEVDKVDGARAIVIDADANSYIMNADPAHWRGSLWEKNLMAAPPALANVLRPRGDYAIIGPGGGVDVLRALGNGSPSVTGIEINPIIANTIMRGRYADYASHLYERPQVHMHVADGRSFIRNSRQHFDVVQMTLVDTWASTAAGAFALSENSLYTVEAFQEYFDHLRPDGLIAVTRWEFRRPRESLRVVSVSMEALHRLGVRNPAGNFIVVAAGDLDEDGIPVVVLAKKTAFTAEEENAVLSHISAYPDLAPLYLPSQPRNNPFSALIRSNDPGAFARDYAYNVAPVTDNSPFFFFTLKLGQVLRSNPSAQGIDWKVNLGVAVLLIVLAISILAVLAFLILPMALRSAGHNRRPIVPLLYFVALGVGYIMVEITFVQRFVLFLGHPTYAITVVVFLLLLSSGLGSMASRTWLAADARIWLPPAAIATLLLLYVFILPGLLNRLVGLPFFAKFAVSAILLVPLGFTMGMPFPAGLRALGSFAETRQENQKSSVPTFVEWAWALNAGASVLGSVMAILVAIRFGLNVTLLSAAAAYALAMMFSTTVHRSHPVGKPVSGLL